MPVKCLVMGLQSVDKGWLKALAQAQRDGIIEIVGAHHVDMEHARAIGLALDVPFFDDERRMLLGISPQMLVMDRPANTPLDFVEASLRQGIGILSLGPPVANIDEARRLAKVLEPTTHLLHVAPWFGDSWAFGQCIQSEEYVRAISFLEGRWHAPNHAAARAQRVAEDAWVVRSLSVLAWDLMRTILELADMPESIYAAIDGTTGAGDHFLDASGGAAITMRFATGGAASLAISDRAVAAAHSLLVYSRAGSVLMQDDKYIFTDIHGAQVDGDAKAKPTAEQMARAAIEDFVRHYTAMPSPHRGKRHRLLETAAMMVAMFVSNRTGDAESPRAIMNIHR